MRNCLFILALLCIAPAFSQRILILEKVGKRKWFRYETGDPILLMTRKDHMRLDGDISYIGDSLFTVNDRYKVPLNDVRWVERFNKHRKSNGIRIAIAGGLVIGIVTVNNLLNNKPVFDPVYLAVGAGITAAGLTWMGFSKPRYHVGTKWKLKVLDYSIY